MHCLKKTLVCYLNLYLANGQIKPVEYSATSKQLSIYSRGLLREDIARQVLITLALIDVVEEINFDNTTELNSLIKPYMEKFLKARL